MLDTKALAETTALIVREHVERATAPLIERIAFLEARQLEKGEKGDPGEPGEKGADGKDGRDGADGQNGKDGAGIADLLRDHEGNLVATFTDGRLKNLGPIQGKDGRDGRDGFQLEDFDCRVLDDDRTIELAFRAGSVEHIATLKWPTLIDRGVFKAGESYERGDAVTWAGSIWIAQKDTEAKPDTPDSGWRLAVKRGRDGKDKA